jgi:gamma-glutamylcyclotransferase (GGCT)/AIG2-like uncharacterized protein YtfP
MMHSVFVYGTLKSGFFNYRLLGGCEFFGGAVTVPTEPPRDCRRLFGLSYAAMAGCSSMA